MYCQVCGGRNDDEREYCHRCHQKLMVISGPVSLEDQETFDSHPDEQFSFDEHLLERISALEEVVRRTADTVRQSLTTLYKLEQKILVNQTGVTTLRDLLETKRVIAREEWSELWESRMDLQLLALEKRERFVAVKERMAALFRGKDPEAFNRRLDEAEIAFLSFDIEGAIRRLEEAHGLDRANHELAFFLGEIFFNEGQGDAALRYFQRVLASKPEHFESLVYGGVLLHDQGDSDRAEDLLKRSLALYPDRFMPAFSLGAIYAADGRLSQAMACLERAVQAEPVPQAYYLLGSCCYEMGRVGAAIRHLNEAVRRDPSFENAHYLLGLAYLDRRWYRKAMKALREAQRLRPRTLRYRELLRLLDADVASLPEVDEKAGVLLFQAEEELRHGHGRQALSSYRQALAVDPDNPTLLVAYSMACLELGRAQEVESVVDKVLTLDSGERLRATACATLIESLRLEGRYREGNRVGNRLLDEGRTDFARAVACFELAFNTAEIGEDLDSALSYAQRALELSSDELRPYPLAALGWIHFQRREFDQAVGFLRQSIQLELQPRTLIHYGMALLAAGQRDRAREILVQARRLEQRNVFEGQILECLRDETRLLQAIPLRADGT